MAAFWAAASNKVKLINLLWLYIIRSADVKLINVEVVLCGTGITGVNDLQPCQKIQNGDVAPLLELDKDIVEADLRVFPRAMHTVTHGVERLVLLTSDTDVLLLAAHYCSVLQAHDLQELWMSSMAGDTVRYIPVHAMANSMGLVMCKMLSALQSYWNGL